VAELPIFASNRESGALGDFMALYGAPAYVRRALRMQGAWDTLVEHWGRRRHEELAMPRMLLAVLQALAGSWTALRPWLADDEQLTVFERLEADLRPTLRQPLQPTRSGRKLRRALRELVHSLERFNRRWSQVLPEVDLGAVNDLRTGYNRYYVMEKECALRSPQLARQGFQPMPPATTADLAAALPVLPIPCLAGL
jgi:hypothetical protein